MKKKKIFIPFDNIAKIKQRRFFDAWTLNDKENLLKNDTVYLVDDKNGNTVAQAKIIDLAERMFVAVQENDFKGRINCTDPSEKGLIFKNDLPTSDIGSSPLHFAIQPMTLIKFFHCQLVNK